MSRFFEDSQITPHGRQLIRMIDQHIAAKTGMTEELRHYAAVVYKTRLMKPTQWLERYPEKAETLWSHLMPDAPNDDDDDQPPSFGTQPWLITK